jgi:type I restriction enzyme, S subunit
MPEIGPSGSMSGEWRRSIATAPLLDSTPLNPIYSDEGIPTVRSPDVGWGTFFLNTALKTNEAEYQRRTSRGEPIPGDIVVVREGGGTGKAAIVETGQRFSLGQRVMMLRPDRDKIDPKYLLYHELSPLIFEDQIINSVMGSASPHLNIGAARTFQIRLPPLSRRRGILAYLDDFQARANQLRQKQINAGEEIEAMLPAILDRAFRGEL